MTTYYRITNGPGGGSITLLGSIEATVYDTAENYSDIVAYVTTTNPDDIDPVLLDSMVSPKTAVDGYVSKVSERVSFQGNTLFFDGDPIDDALSNTIVELAKDDTSGDPTKLVKFLENLMTNTSESVRDSLYSWISDRKITITNDGHFLAYKGIRDDMTSVNAGVGIVNSVRHSYANLDNSPGNIIEVPRSYVDSNRDIYCSTGLHAGTFEYASGFAPSNGVVVLVKINPRDVVTVPPDHESQKLRVCRYEVLEVISSELNSSVYVEDTDDNHIDGSEVEEDTNYMGADEVVALNDYLESLEEEEYEDYNIDEGIEDEEPAKLSWLRSKFGL